MIYRIDINEVQMAILRCALRRYIRSRPAGHAPRGTDEASDALAILENTIESAIPELLLGSQGIAEVIARVKVLRRAAEIQGKSIPTYPIPDPTEEEMAEREALNKPDPWDVD